MVCIFVDWLKEERQRDENVGNVDIITLCKKAQNALHPNSHRDQSHWKVSLIFKVRYRIML